MSDLKFFARLALAAISLAVLAGCRRGSQIAGGAGLPDAPVNCNEPVWDFGVVDQTAVKSLTHTFRLTNSTDQTIEIDEIKTTCGCVVAENHPEEIPANGTADIEVSVRTAGRPGEFGKSLEVILESLPSSIRLDIRGTLAASPAFYAVPSQVDFGTLDEFETKTRVLKVARYDASPVRFLDLKAESDALALQGDVRRLQGGSQVELMLELDASRLNPGRFESRVVVRSEGGEYSQFSIPVRARIKGEPHGLVSSITVQELSKGSPWKGLLTASPDASLGEVSLDYEGDDGIAVELVKSEDGPKVRVSATVECDAGQNRVVEGMLLVSLAGRTKPVRIPILAVIPLRTASSETTTGFP